MIDTHIYKIPKTADFYVVSTSKAINDLNQYVQQHVKNEDIILADFLRRIEFHDAFCYAEPFRLSMLPTISAFKKRCKKRNHWINMDSFVEAQCVAHPEVVLENWPFPLENLIHVIRVSAWPEVFDVDSNAIMAKLLNTPRKDLPSKSDHKH